MTQRHTHASLLVSCIGGVLLMLHGTPAIACSLRGNEVHSIEANASDTSPPTSPMVRAKVRRLGEDGDSDGCESGSGTSCDDVVVVDLEVSARDDVSGSLRLGYLAKTVGDDAPTTGTGDNPVQARDGVVTLGWDQEADDDVNFEVDVWAVDAAGNVSDQPSRARVRSNGNGCSFARGGHYEWMALPLLLWLNHRRTRGHRRFF